MKEVLHIFCVVLLEVQDSKILQSVRYVIDISAYSFFCIGYNF